MGGFFAVLFARRVGLPSRMADNLEGESLFNDATGLLAFQFATAILAQKHPPATTLRDCIRGWRRESPEAEVQ